MNSSARRKTDRAYGWNCANWIRSDLSSWLTGRMRWPRWSSSPGHEPFEGPCQSVPRQRARSAANANSAGRGALPRRTHDSVLPHRQIMRARRSRRSHRRPDWPRLRVPSTQGCRGHPGSPPPQAEAGSRRPANSARFVAPKVDAFDAGFPSPGHQLVDHGYGMVRQGREQCRGRGERPGISAAQRPLA